MPKTLDSYIRVRITSGMKCELMDAAQIDDLHYSELVRRLIENDLRDGADRRELARLRQGKV